MTAATADMPIEEQALDALAAAGFDETNREHAVDAIRRFLRNGPGSTEYDMRVDHLGTLAARLREALYRLPRKVATVEHDVQPVLDVAREMLAHLPSRGVLDTPDRIEQVFAGTHPWATALCKLPGCGKMLWIERTEAKPVYAADTAADLAFGPGYVSTWEVHCEGGHVLLNPPDTAEDGYTFGQCRCEPTDRSDAADCGHGDLDRLRAIIGGMASPE